jgi:hypothetical protein
VTLLCACLAAGELLKKGPGQYKVPGVTLTQQQPAGSQGPADSGIHPGSRYTAAGGSSQRKRPRQQHDSQRQQQRGNTQGQRQYGGNSQYQSQALGFGQQFEEEGSDDGYDDGY